MRRADAPGAGWYPDPQHRERLRWWDGLDWTDIKRAPPSSAELTRAEEETRDERRAVATMSPPTGPGVSVSNALQRNENAQIVEDVRMAAREEIDRAAQEFSDRASTAIRRVSPLIENYTSNLMKWVRRAIAISIVLLSAYFIFQVVVQASFFDWLGDRIDNITDESGLDVTTNTDEHSVRP